HSRGVLFHRETARPEDSLIQGPSIPRAAWFRGHLRKVRRQSTDREHGSAQGILAVHTTWVTSVSPKPGFPRTLAGMKLANHRVNHPVAGTDVRWEDPMAS